MDNNKRRIPIGIRIFSLVIPSILLISFTLFRDKLPKPIGSIAIGFLWFIVGLLIFDAIFSALKHNKEDKLLNGRVMAYPTTAEFVKATLKSTSSVNGRVTRAFKNIVFTYVDNTGITRKVKSVKVYTDKEARYLEHLKRFDIVMNGRIAVITQDLTDAENKIEDIEESRGEHLSMPMPPVHDHYKGMLLVLGVVIILGFGLFGYAIYSFTQGIVIGAILELLAGAVVVYSICAMTIPTVLVYKKGTIERAKLLGVSHINSTNGVYHSYKAILDRADHNEVSIPSEEWANLIERLEGQELTIKVYGSKVILDCESIYKEYFVNGELASKVSLNDIEYKDLNK